MGVERVQRLTVAQYTYYTLSALGYRVPNFVKRTLTTMQITQFLVGASFAALHLFVSYTVPVSVAHKIAEQVSHSVQPSSLASTVSSAVSSVTQTASAVLPTATGPALAFLWKLVYRAAGDEGLAENIPVPGSSLIPAQQLHTPTPIAAHHENLAQRILHPHHNTHTVDRIVYRTEYQHVPCIDTSGQAFAIYLNLIYLAPLTGLFMRFFVKSYFRRTNPKAKHQSKHTPISKAAGDALHGVEREIESISEEGKNGSANQGSVRGRKGVNGNVKNARSSLSPSVEDFGKNVVRKASQRLQEIGDEAQGATEKAKETYKDVANKATETKDKIQQQAKETNDKIEQKAQQNADEVNAEREQGENDVASTPAGTPSKKKRNRNKNKNKNKISDSVESLNDASDDEHPERKTEKEPEPKDINNTLDKNEGKGLF